MLKINNLPVLPHIKPQLLVAFIVASEQFNAEGADCVIKSIEGDGPPRADGKQPKRGAYVDFGTDNVDRSKAQKIASAIESHLSPNYEVRNRPAQNYIRVELAGMRRR